MKSMKWGMRSGHAGFTLVEMILVMVILATLAAVVVPKFVGRGEQAKVTAAQSEIKNYETALDAFEVDNGFFPKSADGLYPLIDEPNDAKNWRGPYLKEVKDDPWGTPYVYEYPGKNNTRGYDLYSAGPDTRPGNEDDIVNWTTTERK